MPLAANRDELPPFQVIEPHRMPHRGQDRKAGYQLIEDRSGVADECTTTPYPLADGGAASMSESGQTEKNSLRANVGRVAPESGRSAKSGSSRPRASARSRASACPLCGGGAVAASAASGAVASALSVAWGNAFPAMAAAAAARDSPAKGSGLRRGTQRAIPF
jgi:hypothetical protein